MKSLITGIIAIVYTLLNVGIAYAGDITMPLGTTGSSSTTPYTNSWFDHDGPIECHSAGTCNGTLTESDGTVLASNVSLEACTIRVNCYDSHAGVDFEASCSTPLYASMSGTVTKAGSANDGYGNRVRIWNAGSGYAVMTAHMDTISVSASDTVYRGQLIGYSGNTPDVSCHLHFGAYNTSAATGGSPLDPSGWTSTGSDPYSTDIGNLWATRAGFMSSGGAVSVKDPYLASGFSTLVSSGASNFSIGDSRVGYVSGGSVWVKDGALGSGWTQEWSSSNGNAARVLLAGRRIVIIKTNGDVWAKDGDLSAGWQGGTAIATGVSSVYTSKNWTAILFSNQELYVKAGLGDGWTDVAGGVTSAGMSRTRLVALFYDGSVYA